MWRPVFPGNPLKAEDHERRFRDCLAFAKRPMDEGRALELVSAIRGLEHIDDVRRFVRLLSSLASFGWVCARATAIPSVPWDRRPHPSLRSKEICFKDLKAYGWREVRELLAVRLVQKRRSGELAEKRRLMWSAGLVLLAIAVSMAPFSRLRIRVRQKGDPRGCHQFHDGSEQHDRFGGEVGV